jgi:hypothetical protein
MKLLIFITSALPICLAGLLCAAVRAPNVGVVRYADGTVRPVYGLEANLIAGGQMLPIADAVSFSDYGGLVALNGRIQLVGPRGALVAEYNSHERKPVLNIDRGLRSAIAYLPSREALLRWNGKSFVLRKLNRGTVSGTVTSVQFLGAQMARLLTTTKNDNVSEVMISLETGELVSERFLPGVKGPAFLYQAFVLFRGKQGLEVEAPGGSRRTVPLPANDFQIQRMSSDWLHLSSPSIARDWVLHLNRTALDISELPAAPPREIK